MTLDNNITRTHKTQILAHLQSGQSITHMEADRFFGCTSLAQRIYDLRKQGIEIVAERLKFTNRNGHKGACFMYHLKAS